jgi:hypothetical protein
MHHGFLYDQVKKLYNLSIIFSNVVFRITNLVPGSCTGIKSNTLGPAGRANTSVFPELPHQDLPQTHLILRQPADTTSLNISR